MHILHLMWLGSSLNAMAVYAGPVALIQDSGLDNQGVVAVNQAAGNANQQANQQAVAISDGDAQALLMLKQHAVTMAGSPPSATASIGGAAFAASMGLIAVNQSAGNANQSFNALALAMGPHAQVLVGSVPAHAQDAVLAAVAVPAAEPVVNGSGGDQTSISAAAFQGSRGLVQLNQIAGSHNMAANVMAVQWANP